MLSYLIAEPKIGKTMFELNEIIADAEWLAAGNRGAGGTDKDAQPIIVLFSLEMGLFVLVTRMLANLASRDGGRGVNSRDLQWGRIGYNISTDRFDDAELNKRIQVGAEGLSRISPYIYVSTKARDTGHQWAILQQLQDRNLRDNTSPEMAGLDPNMNYDIHCVYIDYLALMTDESLDGSPVTKREGVSHKLVEMKDAFNCHVWTIVDVNREGERNGSPKTEHAKWGNATLYDCDFMWTADRPGMAEEKDDPEKYAAQGHGPNFYKFILTLAANRHGDMKTFILKIDPKSGTFENWRGQ
jgi:replicative DNA helicase